MAETVKVTKQFKTDFDAVCRKYHCSPSEVAEMKVCAREHMADAVRCFSLLAKEK